MENSLDFDKHVRTVLEVRADVRNLSLEYVARAVDVAGRLYCAQQFKPESLFFNGKANVLTRWFAARTSDNVFGRRIHTNNEFRRDSVLDTLVPEEALLKLIERYNGTRFLKDARFHLGVQAAKLVRCVAILGGRYVSVIGSEEKFQEHKDSGEVLAIERFGVPMADALYALEGRVESIGDGRVTIQDIEGNITYADSDQKRGAIRDLKRNVDTGEFFINPYGRSEIVPVKMMWQQRLLKPCIMLDGSEASLPQIIHEYEKARTKGFTPIIDKANATWGVGKKTTGVEVNIDSERIRFDIKDPHGVMDDDIRARNVYRLLLGRDLTGTAIKQHEEALKMDMIKYGDHVLGTTECMERKLMILKGMKLGEEKELSQKIG